jgi:hypothetical protein
MSDVDTQVVESAAAPEVQTAAEKMGWIPPSRFKGDPERFIDADAYIERGETILPIVKEHNKRLQTELATVREQAAANAEALKVAQTAIEQIEERHSVQTQKAVEEARRQVKAQLAAASEAGDHEGVAELTDQLTQLNTAEKEAGPVEKKPATPPARFVPPPELREWNEENPWFGQDRRKTALALGIAQELREQGESATGKRFFDMVKVELEATLGSGEKLTLPSKVEGARNGSDQEERHSGKKGFAALPAEAKAACDADLKKFVGEGKRYKTPAEWRNRFAEIYFEGS